MADGFVSVACAPLYVGDHPLPVLNEAHSTRFEATYLGRQARPCTRRSSQVAAPSTISLNLRNLPESTSLTGDDWLCRRTDDGDGGGRRRSDQTRLAAQWLPGPDREMRAGLWNCGDGVDRHGAVTACGLALERVNEARTSDRVKRRPLDDAGQIGPPRAAGLARSDGRMV